MTNNLALPLLIAVYLAFSQLLIVWTALGSHLHWFWRLTLLLGWMGLTLLVGADELMMLVAVSAGIVVPGILLILGRTGNGIQREFPRQFQLMALGQMTAVVAACLALGSQVKGSWSIYSYAVLGGFPAVLLLLGVFTHYSRRPLGRIVGAVFLLATIVIMYLAAHQGEFSSGLFDVDGHVQLHNDTFGFTRRILLLLPAPVVVIAIIGLLSVDAKSWPWLTNVCHGAAKLAVVAFSGAVAWIAYHMSVPIPLPPTDMPDPNAYQAILDLPPKWHSESFVIPRLQDQGADARLTFLAENEQDIERVRLAMAKPGKVILQDSDEENYRLQLATDRIGYAMRIKAVDADAVDRILIARDLLRLGQRTSVGGLTQSLLNAQRLIRPGVVMIAEQRTELDRETCVSLLQDLRSIDEAWEPLSLIRQREVAYVLRKGNWKARLTWMAHKLGDEDHFVYHPTSFGETLARLHLLEAELALRVYYLEKNHWPAALEELVPQYLDHVPLDPFTEAALVYRTVNDGYLLYSVGEDQVDHGGRLLKPGEASWREGGDITIDVDRDSFAVKTESNSP